MKEKEMIERLEAGEDPLELSIEKWQDILDGTGEELGDHNCALCVEFGEHCDCDGCPIAEDGHPDCEGTMYVAYRRALHERLETHSDDKTAELHAAKKELEYLKSLRPLWKKMKKKMKELAGK